MNKKKPFIETFWKPYLIWILVWLLDFVLTYIAITYYGAVETNPISSFFLEYGWFTAFFMSAFGIAVYCLIMGYIYKTSKTHWVKSLPLAFYIWLVGTHIITVIHNFIELNRLMNL